MVEKNKLVVFITGATVGLGRLAAKKCIDLGHTVIITGRSEEKVKAASGFILNDSPQYKDNLHHVILDLKDLKSIKAAVDKFETFGLTAIDVLVNSAGGTLTEFKQVNGKVEETIFMNAVAPLYLTELLLPYIQKSSQPKKRILFLASSLHDRENIGGSRSEVNRIPENVTMEDITGDKKRWDSMKYYKLSKLACVWDTYELASQYPDIIISTFCPGFVPTTELIRNSNYMVRLALKYAVSKMDFTTSEEEATDDYVYYITSSDIESSKYYQKRKVSQSSKESLDETKRKAYWELANQIINDLK